MANFATIDDVTTLFRPLTSDEQTRAEALLTVVSDRLRYEAHLASRDLDTMIAADQYLSTVAKQVTVDVVGRCLMTSTNSEPMTQMSQSALGYSVSGTFLSPGGGLFIKKSELAALGLRRGKVMVIDTCGFPE